MNSQAAPFDRNAKRKTDPMRMPKPMFMSSLGAIVLLTALLPAGCERENRNSRPQSTPEVAVLTVELQAVELTTELPGRTSAYRVAEIRPQVSGLLQKRLFTEGADVEAGQILYQIDPATFQAAVDNARANLAAVEKAADRARAALEAGIAEVAQRKATLALARTNQGRLKELLKKDAVSVSEYDRADTETAVAEAALKASEAQVESDRVGVAAAEADIEKARASFKTALINLDYTRIIAPIAGRIGRSTVTEGAIVTAYQPQALAVVQQLDPMYVDIPQATSELLRLKRRLAEGRLNQDETNHRRIGLLLEDGTRYPLEGTLQFRDVTVEPGTGSVVLRAVFPNPEGTLLPGMFVRAVVSEGINAHAVLIPQQAVSRDTKGNPTALVVDAEDKVAQRALTVDRAIGNRWLVSAGLSPGERIVVEGVQKARAGDTVKTVPFQQGQRAEAAAEPAARAAEAN
jgi:membrane fusion protein (multidrug efflux system)